MSIRLGAASTCPGRISRATSRARRSSSCSAGGDAVFLMPEEDGERVSRLVAFVVAPEVAPETILGALRRRIDAAFLPRPLLFVSSLPRNALGKVPRDALLRLISAHGSE